MVVGVAAPLLGNVLSLFVLSSSVPDLTPILFTVTGLALVVGIFRYSLVEVSPVASEAKIGELDQPAFVVTDRDRIADINPAAGAVLEVDTDEIVGSDIDEAFSVVPDLHERYTTSTEAADGMQMSNDLTGESHRVTTEEVSALGDALDETIIILEPNE